MNWRFHMVWIIEKTCVSHIGISISPKAMNRPIGYVHSRPDITL